MSIKILYLPKNFIPPQNRFLATPLVTAALCVQLQFSCERHLSELTAMQQTGDSLSKCLSLVAELEDFEKLSKVGVCLLKFLFRFHATFCTSDVAASLVVDGCHGDRRVC